MAGYPGYATPDPRGYFDPSLDPAQYADYADSGVLPPPGVQQPVPGAPTTGDLYGLQQDQAFQNAAQGVGMLLQQADPETKKALDLAVKDALANYTQQSQMPAWQRILQNVATTLQGDPLFGTIGAIAMGATNTPYRGYPRDPLSSLTGVLNAQAGMQNANVASAKAAQQQQLQDYITRQLGGGGGPGTVGSGTGAPGQVLGANRMPMQPSFSLGPGGASVSFAPGKVTEQYEGHPGGPLYKTVPDGKGGTYLEPARDDKGEVVMYPKSDSDVVSAFKQLNLLKEGIKITYDPATNKYTTEFVTRPAQAEKYMLDMGTLNQGAAVMNRMMSETDQYDLGDLGQFRKFAADAKANLTNVYNYILGEKPVTAWSKSGDINDFTDDNRGDKAGGYNPNLWFDPGLGKWRIWVNSLAYSYLAAKGQTGRSVSNYDMEQAVTILTGSEKGYPQSFQQFAGIMKEYRQQMRDAVDAKLGLMADTPHQWSLEERDNPPPELVEGRKRWAPDLFPEHSGSKEGKKTADMINKGSTSPGYDPNLQIDPNTVD